KTTVGAFVKVQQETKNIPEMDTYALAKLSAVATAAGNKDTTTATSANAYTLLLAGSEHQDDNFIPESGRIAFCTPAYINLLKQDDNFTNTASETGSKRAINGEVGTVDGIRIIKAPKAWLPTKCNFILTHPAAGAFPRVINDLRTHEDPPGLNGALIEMREVYDCFVLEQKKESIYTNFNA
ncbi:MAG: N4-gp56 family major capsid protein, partial [Alteromonadales bacterium]|nr:N4-gp56 family major capsid protein [Alteromonadales bacterium]